jgi:hypothetical protein
LSLQNSASSPSGKSFLIEVHKCSEKQKDPSVSQCALSSEINNYVDNLVISTNSIQFEANLKEHEHSPLFQR